MALRKRPSFTTANLSWWPREWLTLYAIARDHSRKLEFFRVSVPEARHWGVGFQVPVGPWIVGVSVGHFPRRRERCDAA